MLLNKNSISGGLVILLFILGLFLPTSINGEIYTGLEILSWAIFITLVTTYIYIDRRISATGVVFGLAILIILALATIFSPLKQYAFGALLPFIAFFVLICARWKNSHNIYNIETLLFIVSCIFLVASTFIVTGLVDITEFLKHHYSAFYSDLLHIMLVWNRKPVLTFASHSIAGFYFFLFFYLNFRTYQYSKKVKYLVVSVLFIFMSLFLRSVTAYSFTLISIIYAAFDIYNKPKILAAILGSIGILAGLVIYLFGDILDMLSINQLIDAFGSEGNGLNARYGSTSALQPMINFIAENPFRPVGITNSPDFYFGDSGFVIFYLRGSVFLVVVFYLAFMLFVRNNLHSLRDTIMIIFVYMLFELGFINLGYFRSVYILPFVIFYLNHLSIISNARISRLHGDENQSLVSV